MDFREDVKTTDVVARVVVDLKRYLIGLKGLRFQVE